MPDSRLSHIQDSQERLELSVLLDRADRVADRMTPEVSGFMSPRIAQLATGILPGVRGIRFRLEGGFREVERCRILIWPDEPWAEEPDPETVLIRMEPRGPLSGTPGHRDYMGALLGLGISRDRLGDIRTDGAGAVVAADRAMGEYILANLTAAGRTPLKVFLTAREDQGTEEPETVEISVSSMRLDAVLARGFHLSRQEAEKKIQGEHVQLNWKIQTRASAPVAPSDLISCRGNGRLRILEVAGTSRKGKIRVIVSRNA